MENEYMGIKVLNSAEKAADLYESSVGGLSFITDDNKSLAGILTAGLINKQSQTNLAPMEVTLSGKKTDPIVEISFKSKCLK